MKSEGKKKQKKKITFLSMDELFEKYKNYGQDVNTDILLDDDLYHCEQYPLPEWWGKGGELIGNFGLSVTGLTQLLRSKYNFDTYRGKLSRQSSPAFHTRKSSGNRNQD